VWESALFAAKYKLDNLVWIIDRNNIQIDGYTSEVMPIEPLHDKFASFNFYVIEIDGHNIAEFIDACRLTETIKEQPAVIIAHTIPGKGVSFMENNPAWHGKPPQSKAQLNKALQDLKIID
ncbi:transketolase, partial [Candidatus Parcubacteria bacterium]